MSCIIKSLTGTDSESQLFKQLIEVANQNEELATSYANYFKSSIFKNIFGDYVEDSQRPLEERQINKERVNDLGEPLLIKEENYVGEFKDKYYFLDKNNTKHYFPKEGLNSVIDLNTINSLKETLASQYIQTYFGALQNISSPDFDIATKETLEEFITKKLVERRDELNKLGGLRNTILSNKINDILKHTEELNKIVIDHFSSLKLKYKEDTSETEYQEDQGKDELFTTSSFEKNYKDNINAEVKLMLSLIENKKEGSQDHLLGENSFYKYEFVYNTILKLLAGTHVPYGKDKFTVYLNKLEQFQKYIPMLEDVVDILKNPLVYNNPSLRNKFVQSFELNRNIFITYNIEKNDDGVSFKYFDVSELNDNRHKIKKSWGLRFKDLFSKQNIYQKDKRITYNINSRKVETFQNKFTKFTKNAVSKFETESTANNDIYEAQYNELQQLLHELGVEVTPDGFEYFIMSNAKDNTNLQSKLDVLNNIKTKIGYFLKDIVEDKIEALGGVEDVFNHSSIFQDLAEAEAIFFTDVSDASFFSAGKTYWSYSKKAYLSNKVMEIKEDLDFHNKLKNNSGFYDNSRLLEYIFAEDIEDPKLREIAISDRMSQFNEGILNSFQVSGNLSTGVNNKDLFENDEIVMSVNSLLGFKVNKDPFIRTSTPADKSSQRVLQLPKEIFVNSNYRHETGEISQDVIDVLYNYFLDEYKRMSETADAIEQAKSTGDRSSLFKHFHFGFSRETKQEEFALANGLQSQLFPSLSVKIQYNPESKAYDKIENPLISEENNPILYDPITGYPSMRDGFNIETEILIKEHIKNAILKKIAETEAKLKEVNLFDGIANQKTENLNLDKEIFKKYENANSTENHFNIRYQIAADFYINGIITNVEYSKLFTGDYAYYKDMVDYKKRVPATYTDGQYINSEKPTFRVAVISSVLGNYSNAEEFQDLVSKGILTQEVADYYINKDDINIADGQAWITPSRWKEIKEGLGEWSEKHDEVYSKIINNETLNPKDLKIAMQPLKGVYFENLDGKPTFLKYSQAVLIPSLIQGTSFESVYNKMIDPENGFEELLSEDAVKAGVMNPVKSHQSEDAEIIDSQFDINSLPTYELSNSSWKLQQNLPTKLNKDIALGSQIQKNVLQGLFRNKNTTFNYKGNEYSAEEILDEINNVIGKLSDKGLSRFYKRLGISKDGVIKNKTLFLNKLADQFIAQGGDLNVIKALRAGVNPFGIPQAGNKITQMFASMVLEETVKIKTNGGSFIQMSGYGLNFNEATSKGVLFTPWAKNKNGEYRTYAPSILKDKEGNDIVDSKGRVKIKPAGMFVPGHFIAKYVPNYRELYEKDPSLLFGVLNEETGEYEGGLIDSKILRNWIGYRIPNQGLSSNDAFEIAGILPDGLGDTIIAYTGLTTKTGSDFDIDKLYFMSPYIKPIYSRSDNDLYDQTKQTLQKWFKGVNRNDTAKRVDDFIDELLEADENLNVQDFDTNDLLDFIYEDDGDYNQVDAYEMLADIVYDTQDIQIQSLLDIKDIMFERTITRLEYSSEGNKGLANDLIELYQSILLNPDVLNDVMTPVDFAHIKDNVNTFHPQEEVSDLDAFDIIKDIQSKMEYKAGKAGVGMEANALIDSIKGSFADLNLGSLYIGAGNKDSKGSVLDKENSEELTKEELEIYMNEYNKRSKKKISKKDLVNLESFRITDSISAVLNAFVDIAKDPYITRGNWNTITTNTGNLLLRLGVHPFKVNALLGHKVIKDYIKFQQNREAITTKDTGKMFEKYKLDLFRNSKLMTSRQITITGSKDVRTLSYAEFHKFLFGETTSQKVYDLSASQIIAYMKKGGLSSKVLEANAKEIEDFIDVLLQANVIYNTSFKIPENYFPSLESMLIENEDHFTDLANSVNIFAKFNSMQQLSKSLRDSVNASRADVQGMGKSTASLVTKANIIKRLLGVPIFNEEGVIERYVETENVIKNFHKKFIQNGKKTMLGYYTTNSIFEIMNIVKKNPSLFFETTPVLMDVKNIISNDLYGVNKIESEFLAEKIDNYLKGLVLSNFKLFKTSNKVYEYLIGEDFTNEYVEFKKKNRNKYKILQELNLESGVYSFSIGLSNRNRNATVKQDLVNSWLEMFHNAEDRHFAVKLAKYAYIVSGLENNKSQFFSLIPTEMMISYGINEYLDTFTSANNINPEVLVQEIYKNNIEDDLLIPNISNKDMIQNTINNFREFIQNPELTTRDVVFKIKLEGDETSGEPFENPKRFYKQKIYDKMTGVAKGYRLYELHHVDSDLIATYVRTKDKGKTNRGNFIYEYDINGNYKLPGFAEEFQNKIDKVINILDKKEASIIRGDYDVMKLNEEDVLIEKDMNTESVNAVYEASEFGQNKIPEHTFEKEQEAAIEVENKNIPTGTIIRINEEGYDGLFKVINPENDSIEFIPLGEITPQQKQQLDLFKDGIDPFNEAPNKDEQNNCK